MTEPIDLHKSEPPAIVEKAPQQTGAEKAMQDINARLALSGLKAELPDSMEIQKKRIEKIVWDDMIKEGDDKIYSGIKATYVKKGVWAMRDIVLPNVQFYVNDNGETQFVIGSVRKRAFVDKVYEDMSIRVIKKDGKTNIYRVENNGNTETLKGPVNPDSPEAFEIWTNIIFYSDVYDKLYMLKHNLPENKIGIEFFIKHGAFKYEDLELFKQKGMIDDELFKLGLQEFKKVIVSQCSDSRLIKLGIGIKESDIKKYLEKGYIDTELAKKCYEALPLEMKDLSKK